MSETVLELPQAEPVTSPKPHPQRNRFTITPELSRLYRAKAQAGNKARAAKAQNPAQEEAKPEPGTGQEPGAASGQSGFVRAELARVRSHLAQVHALIESNPDPSTLPKLVTALTGLAELERTLADRPLPGSKRPSDKPKRSRSSWLMDEAE